MKRLLLLVSVLLAFHHPLLAQKMTCGSELNLDSIEKHDPSRYKRILEIEKHLERYLETLSEEISRTTPTTISIPVVVHVLHNGEAIGTGLNIGSQRNSDNVFGR